MIESASFSRLESGLHGAIRQVLAEYEGDLALDPALRHGFGRQIAGGGMNGVGVDNAAIRLLVRRGHRLESADQLAQSFAGGVLDGMPFVDSRGFQRLRQSVQRHHVAAGLHQQRGGFLDLISVHVRIFLVFDADNLPRRRPDGLAPLGIPRNRWHEQIANPSR